MTTAELQNIKADKVVDARGVSCPGPIMAAKKAIADVKVGEVMEILATDSGSQRDIPAWARKMGHEFLGVVEEAGYWKLYVKRMK
ncbi:MULTISPECIES: sulfurtransferase TusA family protein [Desulfofundulus]|nr:MULTISPECIES: sulfurtransferase TusA family protein [Desulfofundulus]MBE3585439.1 sulfurtransferase TusA family protein [Thermoanaerobacter sp.]MCS5695592.1 sulfurtransferase TusA family protein [Desulfofundulus thermocisternus]